MKRNKTVLRSLLSVLLIVTLCLTAITGVTFALMKDVLSSENNVIKSGTLKIDIEVRQSNGEYLSVRKNDIPVLNYDRWEAGYTQVLNARVVNSGTLSLAYEMEVLAEGIVEAMLNNKPLLSDVIEVYYASSEVLMDTREDFEDAVASNELKHLGNLTQLLLARTVLKDVLHPSKTGEPDADSADYVTFVFKMHDTVSTEYQGLSVGDETFEFNLYAKQNTHETDSFDNKYDIGKTTGVVFDDGQTHVLTDLSVILTPYSECDHAIIVSGENTVVEINGGLFDSSSKGCAIWVKDKAKVIINSGVFFCEGLGKPATELEHQTLIYAGDGGTVEIRGGYFASRSDGAWLLDRHDTNGTLTVSGGTYKDWNPGDNDSDGPNTSFLKTGTSILANTKGDATFYSINTADNALISNIEGDNMSLVGDLTIVDVPFYQDDSRTTPCTINGNGYTVNLTIYPDNPKLNQAYWYPDMATVFSSDNGSKITVNDITFTGTSPMISAGDYSPAARAKAITEFNNVNIIDLEVTHGGKWCTALNACGTVYLNNCTIRGTKRSPIDPNLSESTILAGMVCSNASKTYINGGSYDSIYLDNSAIVYIKGAEVDEIYTEAYVNYYLKVGENSHIKNLSATVRTSARIYIEDNAIVDELDLTVIGKGQEDKISIANTATVKKIVDGENTFNTYEEWVTFNKA